MERSSTSLVRRRVPLRRLVAGTFLHFGVLAYLVIVPILTLIEAPEGANVDRLLRLGLRFSALFLAVFVVAALVGVAIAAAIDGQQHVRDRRSEGVDARSSRERLERSVSIIDRRFEPARSAATSIASRDWQHGDGRYQSISRDLASVASSASEAHLKSIDEKQVIIDQLLASLAHIDSALMALDAERAAVARQQATATALYIQRRYGDPDFAIKPD